MKIPVLKMLVDGKYVSVPAIKGADGEKGTDGTPGQDGISCTHEWNGTVLTVTSASGTSSADLKGEKGDKGDTGQQGEKGADGADGKDGNDGYTPVKGTDYWTEADKAEIKNSIDLSGKEDVSNKVNMTLANQTYDNNAYPTAASVSYAMQTLSTNISALSSNLNNKMDKDERFKLAYVSDAGTNKVLFIGDSNSSEGVSFYDSEQVDELLSEKADKTQTTPVPDSITSGDITFKGFHNRTYHYRAKAMSAMNFYFDNGVYEEDYTCELSFDSGETPTTISYTNSGILNWLGTDCSLVDGMSIFAPTANKHYDIVFYYNGTCFVGLVNGFEMATTPNNGE